MQGILDRLFLGYVTVPIVAALKARGLVEALARPGPANLNSLAEALRVDEARLAVALRLLESAGWVSRDAEGVYGLTPGARRLEDVSQGILELYEFDIDAVPLPVTGLQERFEHWCRYLLDLSAEDAAFDLLQGPVLVPLLYVAAREVEVPEGQPRPPSLRAAFTPGLADAVRGLSRRLGLLGDAAGSEAEPFPPHGRGAADRSLALNLVVSHRTRLLHGDALLFGGPPRSSSTGLSDETLADAEAAILARFAPTVPPEKRPQVVAFMGCHDAAFLARVRRHIDERSQGGVPPPALLVLEPADGALPRTDALPEGVRQAALTGAAYDWEGVFAALKTAGVEDADSVLHVHFFSVHSAWPRATLARGEYLRHGHEALARGNHHLIVVQAHCLLSEAMKHPRTHLDPRVLEVLQALSGETLVGPETFIVSAATAGLFAKSSPLRYPRASPVCRASLCELEARTYRVRHATAVDLDALLRVEERCWAEGLRMPGAVLARRLGVYPEGQFVVEMNDPAGVARVVGVIYSQRIASATDVRGIDAETASAIHTPDGPVAQLLAVNIDPAFQERQLGDQLLEFMLQRCAAVFGVRSVVAVSLCRDFHKQKSMTMGAYVRHRNDLGQLADPILRFHERHGASIEGLVARYRPNDVNNEGFGVLVAYDIHRRMRKEVEVAEETPPVASPHTAPAELRLPTPDAASPRGGPAPNELAVDGMGEFLERTIQQIVGPGKGLAYSPELPLMELGLDSVGLLELADRISVQYKRRLEPSFLFQYNTPKRIAAHFEVPREKQSVPAAAIPEVRPRQARVEAREGALDTQADGIAIIGMACRLPGGVDDPERLWQLLKEGRSAIGALPEGRWTWPKGIDPVHEHPGIGRGGFLDDIESFDATLFRLSPKEVRTMDPQQRILLELAWEALESSGYSAASVAGSKTGVFIGASGSDYRLLLEQDRAEIEPHLATGSSMAVLPNRISYFFDLRGPSLQVDTACSSSLVAVHEAVQTLRLGRCNLALVGGINIMCHPGNSVAYYKAGMLSKDGRCKTFDESADGYVRSEGAVMLVLKPLRRAVEDGDPIHAVIRGTACNHGGLAGGLTVPNPSQQAELLKEAWAAASVSPRTISYIEAHGTGTKLGDPIEIRGLKEAFSSQEGEPTPESCALSSIKSNLGHLEAAAGIAGLLKVVLSMVHRELPRTVHFNRLNSQIDLARTPFYVVQGHQRWPEPSITGGLPRRAGVSSFGSGGTNAHVVLEEYTRGPDAPAVEAQRDRAVPSRGLFVLSAKNRDRLVAYARRLLGHVSAWSDQGANPSLASLVYSLQRRQALEERVAFVVGSFAELRERLAAFADGVPSPAIHVGNGGQERAVSEFVNQNDDIKDVVAAWLQAGQLERVAKLWAKGVAIDDWDVLYARTPPRIALPAYPFSRERYWLERAPRESVAAPPVAVASPVPQPLVQLEASDAEGKRLSALLTGQEFFLADHQVNGRRVLPAAAHLEFVHEAMRLAAKGGLDGSRRVELKDVAWARPLVAPEPSGDSGRQAPLPVYIKLAPVASGGPQGEEFSFEVYTGRPGTRDEQSTHSSGVVAVARGEERAPLDLQQLRDGLARRPAASGTIAPEAYYRALAALGLGYGPAHRGLDAIQVGLDERGAPGLLAHLVLPECIAETQQRYTLHPSLIDAAIQAAIIVAAGDEQLAIPRLSLPFALKSLEVVRPCTRSMWAWVRRSPEAAASSGHVRHVDLELCDEAGSVCVRIRKLSFRSMESRVEGVRSERGPEDRGLAIFRPVWTRKPCPAPDVARAQEGSAGGEHRLVLCGFREQGRLVQEAVLQGRLPETTVAQLESSERTLAARFESCSTQLFELIQGAIRTKTRKRSVLQVLVPSEGPDAAFSALVGLARTACLENPKLSVQVLALSEKDSAAELLEKVEENRGALEDVLVRYEGGARVVAALEEVSAASAGQGSADETPWKEGGVYLITGGAGGLGLIFAREILTRVRRVSVILTGRSGLSEPLQATLAGMEREGATLRYMSVDVGDEPAVAELVRWIQREFGGLDGVIHSAGGTRDSFLLRKSKDEFQSVLRPKVAGISNLYEATRALDLDFLVSFSSIVAVTGNIGQADYCTANAFLDATAWLHRTDAAQGRRGRVLSINWPLWRDGGMGQNRDARMQLEQQFGLLPMETSAGIAAFYRALASNEPQSVVMNGNLGRIRAFVSEARPRAQAATAPNPPRAPATAPAPSVAEAPAARAAPRDLEREVHEYLKRVMGAVLGLPESRLTLDAPFSSYGMDSILALELIKKLEKDLGSLSKTLLFEHENIGQLGQYLAGEYKEKLLRFLQPAKAPDTAPREAVTGVVQRTEPQERRLTEPPASAAKEPEAPARSHRDTSGRKAAFRLVKKSDLATDTRTAALVASSRGNAFQDVALLEVWPELFVHEDGLGYCHVLRDQRLLFATQYEGKPEHREQLMKGLLAYCSEQSYQFGYLDMSEGRKLDLEASCGLLSTPVGVIQTMENIRDFSLAGGRMRRLRYMVEKFRKLDGCRTVECRELDARSRREILAVIDAWSEEKKVVNNVDVILDDMKTGNLLKRYRVFLTYLGNTLQNVIMILPIEGGYLMDQEYYLPTMPLGGTEFAVTEFLKVLGSEGHSVFSMGLTWGLFEAKEGFSDVAGDALLRNTKTQLKQIFERGAANHQYKEKYGPRDHTVYLYRVNGGDERVIPGCLSQFYRKGITHHDVKKLIAELEAAGHEGPPDEFFDVTRLDPATLRLDLVSDSWSHVTYPFIRERVERLTNLVATRTDGRGAGTKQSGDVVGSLFGLTHFCLTTSGRVAERLFFQTRRGNAKVIPQNVLFESTLHNLVKAGFEPVELPDRAAVERGSSELFRGGIDFVELTRCLEERAGQVAMVFLELCNNASGGYPVSLAQLGRISEASAKHQVPLVMDVTRILRNAELIRRYEAGCGNRDLWDIAKEIASYADVVVGSLCKDFGLSSGGIIAARDAATIKAIKGFARVEGGVPGGLEAEVMLEGLSDRDYLQARVRSQLDIARGVHEKLEAAGVPVVQPGGGHCILVRVDEVPGYTGRKYPRESFLRVLAERYGIRGGIHLVGNQKDTHLNHCVRLALPLGLEDDRLIPSLVSALQAALAVGSHDLPNFMTVEVASRPAPSDVRSVAGRDVAIIGLSGRYPRAETLDEFWTRLMAAERCISEVPEDRWDWREHYHSDPSSAVEHGKSYGKWGGFLEGFQQFDPLFFKMSPREAEYVDPQERLFLMECWKALEDAGYPPSAFSAALRQRIGVFGGITKQGFNLYAAGHEHPYQNTSLASMVSRVSYCLDLKGPALSFDSHCASALVAIHEACEYIRHGKGDLAIAGAVNLNLHPSNYLQLSKMQVLSHNDRSASFAKGGAGYVPGEGAGAVVLKAYSQALEDGDNIYAVIRGSAINQNGRMNRFGMPSQKQIEAVITAALGHGAIDPRTISYIETSAHGSEVGDAIEMAALTKVFSGREGTQGSYRFGSVKPNIGHGEAVSGMSQLTKVLLSLQHKTLVSTLVPDELNPNIDFERLPFVMQKTVDAWEPVRVDGQVVPRRVGITSTGASGVNAHIVLEEHVPASLGETGVRSAAEAGAHPMAFVLSARDGERLKEYAAHWSAFLKKAPQQDLRSLVYTLQTGREAMPARLAIVTSDVRDLVKKLEQWAQRGGTGDGESTFSGDASSAVARSRDDLEGALRANDVSALARWWAQGNTIAWAELYRSGRPRRVGGLPLYPFARESYWAVHKAGRSLVAQARAQPAVIEAPASKPAPAAANERLEARFLGRLAELFAEVFKMPASRLDVREPLESYGIDSYAITVLNAKLAGVFGHLSKTLLFEYQTVGDLARYFLEKHAATCATWAGSGEQGSVNASAAAPANDGAPNAPAEPPAAREDAAVTPRHRGARAPATSSVLAPEEPIAIIGVSGRFPMAKNVHELWENLKRGRDCVVEIPEDRWPLEGFYEPDQERAIARNQCYGKWGGFIDGFADFDPMFFNISPREAMNMDPQERIFLQACWEVLEDGAYTRERIASRHGGRVGVFTGVTRSEFALYGPEMWKLGKSPATSFCSLANRVSYFLNANGPSIPIDTMCSSSLVAVHEACENLRRGECEVAIAGGVNLSLHPHMYVSLSAQRMLSPDGRCKSFGKGGNGYVPGEGVGVILLKPLSRALEDKDRIYAVIRGTSVNHGGKTNGYTVPNPIAQGNVIRRALDKAGIDARMVSYIEAHGTGTELGDPIEVTGLSQAFRKDTSDTGFCALGSVKSNIGHLEAASGIAGLTKVLLQMKHQTLVPSLHAQELNPHIDFASTPFVVNRELRRWEQPVVGGKVHPRIAGISSFGAGGSNAHVIIEEYVNESARAEVQPVADRPVLIVLSAKKPEQLKVYAQNLLDQIREPSARESGSAGLEALAYTLQVGREAMEERLGVIVHSMQELEVKLQAFVEGKQDIENLRAGKAKRSGQHVH